MKIDGDLTRHDCTSNLWFLEAFPGTTGWSGAALGREYPVDIAKPKVSPTQDGVLIA